jgi:hypothetical protein
MLSTTQQSCRNLFPLPAAPPGSSRLNSKFIKYSFCNIGLSGEISVCIADKPAAYKITRVVGSFGDKSTCEPKENSGGLYQTLEDFLAANRSEPVLDSRFLHLSAKATNSPDAFTFEIAGDQFYCYDLAFYGFAN